MKVHKKILDTYLGFFSSGPSFRSKEFLKIVSRAFRVYLTKFGLDGSNNDTEAQQYMAGLGVFFFSSFFDETC